MASPTYTGTSPTYPGALTGGAAAFDGVVAPAATSEKTASAVNFADKTFSAFTDPNGLIDSYSTTTTNADGSCSWSGSGLGPYSATSSSGDSGTLALHALDVSSNVLATAYHTYDRAGAASNPKLVAAADPADQSKAAGTTSSDAITFTAPTGGSGSSTPSVSLAHIVGTGATVSPGGASLGPHTINSLEDGDVVHLICTHTDDDAGDAQVVSNVCVVAVAQPGDLVSGGAATNGSQSKAAGTTSSDAITFQAPTGGSGSSTPSAALAHVVGTGATLSGSGLGPYTVNSLEDGDVVTVTCTHTDDGDGQVVKDVATVSVAASSAAWVTLLEHDFDAGDTADFDTGGDTTYSVNGETITIVGTANTSAWAITANGLEFTGSAAGETTAALSATDLSAHADYSDDRNMTVFEIHWKVDVDTVSTSHYCGLVITDDASDSTCDGGALIQFYRSAAGTLAWRVYSDVAEGGFGATSGSGTIATALSGDQYVGLMIKQSGDIQEFYYRVDSTEQSYAADGHGTPTGWTFARRASRGVDTSAVSKPQAALFVMSRTYAAASNSVHTVMKARVRHYKDPGVSS